MKGLKKDREELKDAEGREELLLVQVEELRLLHIELVFAEPAR